MRMASMVSWRKCAMWASARSSPKAPTRSAAPKITPEMVSIATGLPIAAPETANPWRRAKKASRLKLIHAPTLVASAKQRRLDRSCSVAARIERCGEAPQQNERQKAKGVGGKRRSCSRRILDGEGAACEQRAHDEVRNDDGADCARNCEEERQLDTARL